MVPTYNRSQSLRRCVEAILSQETPGFRAETLVVDDGSPDDTQEVLQAFRDRVRVLRQENAGPARARNAGAREARGEILLFIDDDVIAQPGLLETHLRAHRAGEGPRVLLGYTPIPRDHAATSLMRYFRRRWDSIFDGMSRCEQEGRALPYRFCCSLNLSLPRPLFLETGMFDERFTRADCEDTELGYRLTSRGVPLRFRREALAHHLFTTTLRQDCARNEKNGIQAGRLYPSFTHLKDSFRIRHATFEDRSLRTTARRLLIGARSLRVASVCIGVAGPALPPPVADYLYRLLEINYFSMGVRSILASRSA